MSGSKINTVFFCGHKSKYGLAHLEPLLLSKLNVIVIVIANDTRWHLFRESLSGKNYYLHKPYDGFFKTIIRKLTPPVLLSKFIEIYRGSKNIEKLLKGHKVPLWFLEDVNSEESLEKLKSLKPDLFFSAGYPQIFSQGLITIPKHGAVNCHPSLLPKYRGAHPHYWSIIKGEDKSGLTAHFMTEIIDEGDIIAQIEYPISDYNYSELYNRIIKETPALIKKVEDYFLLNNKECIKQDHTEASYYRNNREIHQRIFWNIHTFKEIINLTRGENAFCLFRNKRLVIEKCFGSKQNRNMTNNVKVENGIIVDVTKESVGVKAKLGIVNITDVKYENTKMKARDFIKKYKLLIGDKFD